MSGVRLGPGREFERIREFLRGGARPPGDVRLGPGDDAAVLEPDLVLSTDLAVEGVHFRLDWITPEEAGARAAAAALSDLAAMAARPVGVLASLGTRDPETASAFMGGLRAEVETRGGVLLGGDLVRSPDLLFVDVVAVGRAASPLLRSGVRPGDELWVTGALGAAAGAVALWRAGATPPPDLRKAYARPVPRIEEARWLAEAGARAAIDLSDGLAGDAAHLAAASQVRIRIEADRLPVHAALGEAASPTRDPFALALRGGDDFELLVALPPGALSPARVEEFRRRFDLPLSRVGRAEAGQGVVLVPPGGGEARPLEAGGYDHFRDEAGSRGT